MKVFDHEVYTTHGDVRSATQNTRQQTRTWHTVANLRVYPPPTPYVVLRLSSSNLFIYLYF
jgi:hypothetical protein